MHKQLSSIPNYQTAFNNNNRYRITNSGRWPGQWHTGPGWANLGYYTGYWWGGSTYPQCYYAPDGYCPTPWLFYPGYGQFWQPGIGYCDYLPNGYNAPITIAVQEIVPVYNARGQIMDYRPETFQYNAYWDPRAQAYGYYDYRGAFHWTTFPWLRSWEE
jgi:hypothetical protein